MNILKQSTAYNLPILMVDSTDHITGKTGLTLTITASKNGAAFASITPTVTELVTGWYNLALTTAHTDTVGMLAIHITSTGADPMDTAFQVFAATTDDLVRSTTPANTLDVSATGEAGLDFANIKAATGATTLTNITVPIVTSVTNEAAKYMHGSVWIDSVNGAAGGSSYVNGIMTNPSNSIANAKNIADNLKLKRFWVQAGSSLTMAAGMVGYYFDGRGYALTNASSRDISGTTIIGCENLTGTWATPTEECYVYWSQVGTSTWGEVDFHDCHITGTITLNAAVPFLFDNCIGITSNSPIIDFNSTTDSRAAILKDFGGSVTIKNMKAGNVLIVNGECDLTIDNTNTAGTVYIAGNVRFTNNGSGQTIYDSARFDEDQSINVADKTGFSLTAAYDPAKTAAQAGNAMTLTAAYDNAKSDVLTPLAVVDGIVDEIKAKTDNLPANPASQTNLDVAVSTRLATASYSVPPSAGDIAAAVWGATTRTLTSFGSLVADVWGYLTRTLTSSGGGASAQEVWEYGTRELTDTRMINLDAPVSGAIAAISVLNGLQVTYLGPMIPGGNAEVICGDDYTLADGRALSWNVNNLPDLTGAVLTFTCGEIEKDAILVGSVISVELVRADTSLLKGSKEFTVKAELVNTHVLTLISARIVGK